MPTNANVPDSASIRESMGDAGWVCAVDDLPGVYIPGPQFHRQNQPNAWLVSYMAIVDLVRRHTDDPALLAMFGADSSDP